MDEILEKIYAIEDLGELENFLREKGLNLMREPLLAPFIKTPASGTKP